MAKHAWSRIVDGDKVIELGDSVTAGDVGGKEQFDQLCAVGVLRDKKPPKTAEGESPREAILRDFNEKLEQAREQGMEHVSEFMSELYGQDHLVNVPSAEDAVEVSKK